MKLEGIITPIVTPFHRDEEQSINYEATKQLIDHLIAKGVKGIFILGSNGEFHVIDEAEKIEFAEKVIEMVDHRVPVYVGTGACSTKETIRLSKKMEELGADALSVITPYFLTPTEEELVQHFTAVAESVSIPIILYNIPKATGCNLSAEVVGRLAEVENIRGIKDSSGKEENLKAYAELAKRDDFDLLIGSDSKISYGYALGASGAVAGTSNVITEVLVELDRALRNGETEKAEELQKDINVLRGVLKLGTVPVVMKRAAELAGIAEIGPARKPVLECSAQDDEKIKEMLQHYHLI
ncbi:MAG: 4-hydroxy-tetrahydrodipicolinate synthase [[Clostridium] innocuum]